jgi:periplasmic protein TonB
MEAKYLATASFDDMVFEGRNKAYGAYQLRQEYNDRMSKAGGICFSSILLLLGLSYAAISMKPDLKEAMVPSPIDREIYLEHPVFEEVKQARLAAAPAVLLHLPQQPGSLPNPG